MAQYPRWQQLYYRYLGHAYVITYWAQTHSFVGINWRTWLIILSWVVGIILATRGWGVWSLVLGLLPPVFVIFSFRQAKRNGYNRFVADRQNTPPAVLRPLPANEQVTVQVTGVFSLMHREDFVLLHNPARYWQVPLGDHILMVEQFPQRFLYQMFNVETLLQVRNGWMIYGTQPQRSLAVTFEVIFGPDTGDNSLRYFVGKGDSAPRRKPRTIYLSFADEADYEVVWHTLLVTARQAAADGR